MLLNTDIFFVDYILGFKLLGCPRSSNPVIYTANDCHYNLVNDAKSNSWKVSLIS